jgi:ZIP family zinc transporter
MAQCVVAHVRVYQLRCSLPRNQVALTIEMGFLGMTFAATLSKQSLSASLPAIIAPPILLIIGAATGAGSAAAVSHLPAVHVGLVSFGVAALLYLVTEELLLEAHENVHEHKWWIDIWFFLGFMASFILAKVTGN